MAGGPKTKYGDDFRRAADVLAALLKTASQSPNKAGELGLEDVMKKVLEATADPAQKIGQGLILGIFVENDVHHILRWNAIFAAFAMLTSPRVSPLVRRTGIRMLAERAIDVMEILPPELFAEVDERAEKDERFLDLKSARKRLHLPGDQN